MGTGTGIGIGIPFRRMGGGIDAQAQAHYNRVIADGGLIPSGLVGVNNFFKTVKGIYGTSDITTAISVGLDAQVLGYNLGAGVGTTAGQAAQKLYSCSGASGDVEQTFASSQPLLLVHSGANYWFSPIVNGNYCTAPSITIPTASGFEIDAKVSFTTNDDLLNSGGWFASHDTGASPNRNIFFGFNGSRYLNLYLLNLTLIATSTAQIPSAFSGWLRVNATTVGADMAVKYYTSTDNITFTQLGATITIIGGANCIKTTAIKFDVAGNAGFNSTAGKYYRVILKDANGVTRADFNPNQYNAATSQTQWTSSTGEVWTINTGTASTGYKGVLVDRTIVQGDGVDDTLVSSTLPSKQFFSQHVALNPLNIPSSGGAYYVDGGGANGLLYGNVDGLIAFNGADLNFIGDLEYRLQYAQIDFNNTNSNLYINNSNNVNGATGTRTTTSIALFSNGSGGAFGNALISTIISAITIDTSTQRTNVYNYVRSINNNAF
jgi:hypothetical protein